MATGGCLMLGVVFMLLARKVFAATRPSGNPYGPPLSLSLGLVALVLLALPFVPGIL